MSIVRIIAVKHDKQPLRYRLVSWFVSTIMGYEYAHCGIQLGEYFYELTESGIGCCLMDELAEDKTLVTILTSKHLPVTPVLLNQYYIVIWALRTAGTRVYYTDIVKYAICVLLKQPYHGRVLCTGFVELVLGMVPTNCPPEELISHGYEDAQA